MEFVDDTPASPVSDHDFDNSGWFFFEAKFERKVKVLIGVDWILKEI